MKRLLSLLLTMLMILPTFIGCVQTPDATDKGDVGGDKTPKKATIEMYLNNSEFTSEERDGLNALEFDEYTVKALWDKNLWLGATQFDLTNTNDRARWPSDYGKDYIYEIDGKSIVTNISHYSYLNIGKSNDPDLSKFATLKWSEYGQTDCIPPAGDPDNSLYIRECDKLVVSYTRKTYHKTFVPDPAFTHEKAKEKALNFLTEKFGEEVKSVYSIVEVSTNSSGFLVVRLTRPMFGYRSADYLTVTYAPDGTLTHLYAFNLNLYDKYFESVTQERVDIAFDKLSAVFDSERYTYSDADCVFEMDIFGKVLICVTMFDTVDEKPKSLYIVV